MAIVGNIDTEDLKLQQVKEFWEQGEQQASAIALDEEDDEVSASITQTWTDQAIKCYLSCADCTNCSIPRGNYSFQCRMNKVVPVLIHALGEPDPSRINRLLPYLSNY